MKNEFAKLFTILNYQVLITKNNIKSNNKYLYSIQTCIEKKEFKLTFACNTIQDLNKEFLLFDKEKAELFINLLKEY